MNILLIGNGAREHAIIEALLRSPQQPSIYSYMKANNPGIAKLSSGYMVGAYEDLDAVVSFAQKHEVAFAFVGPEDPLSLGVVDALGRAGIPSVGPSKNLAQLETSKSFTRILQKKYDIPGTPRFDVFKSAEGIMEFIRAVGEVVVKPDGLTGGKGVKVWGDHFHTADEAFAYCEEVLKDHGAVVIEERLIGQEFSLMSLTDGKTLFDFVPVQDHKRAFVDDKGPNTGGMGSYSTGALLPFMTEQDLKDAHHITDCMREALFKETGELYKGVMYGGFICTKDGVKLIEYNARFGDPEAMNVLPILESDFVSVCQGVIENQLHKVRAAFKDCSTVCKYAVPEGYPTNPVSGEKIELDSVSDDCKVYYASVDQRDDGLYMSSSRAVGFVGIGPSLTDAEKIAEEGVKAASGPIFHREDIGTDALVQKRIDHMKEIRG